MALATDKVRYVGDEVAAVAAVDEDTARAAIDLVEVHYEELPAVFDTESAMADGAPQIHDQYERNTVITIAVERGDVEQAFAESDVYIVKIESETVVETAANNLHSGPASRAYLHTLPEQTRHGGPDQGRRYQGGEPDGEWEHPLQSR